MRSSWSQLAAKDIVSTTEATKTVKDAEKIIKYVKNHHIVKAKFDERRTAANISLSLSMPVSTRWFSYYKSMSSLQLSKYVLIKLVDKESLLLKEIQPKNTSAAVMALIKSNPFWDCLSKLVKSIEFPSNVILMKSVILVKVMKLHCLSCMVTLVKCTFLYER